MMLPKAAIVWSLVRGVGSCTCCVVAQALVEALAVALVQLEDPQGQFLGGFYIDSMSKRGRLHQLF